MSSINNHWVIIINYLLSQIIITKLMLTSSSLFNKEISKILSCQSSHQIMWRINQPFKNVLFWVILSTINWVVLSFHTSNISNVIKSGQSSDIEEVSDFFIFFIELWVNIRVMIIENHTTISNLQRYFIAHSLIKFSHWIITDSVILIKLSNTRFQSSRVQS